MSDPEIEKASPHTDFKASDLGTAMSLLTRIPLKSAWIDPNRLAASAWTFPLVGLLIGAFGGLILKLTTAIGVPPSIAAAVALGAIVLITGGLHEDGLADSADGLGGGSTRERALEIMKDSRIGAYGTIILVLFLIARWSAIADLAGVSPILGLMWVGAVSRVPMVLLMTGMPHARDDGLSRHVGRPSASHALVSSVLIALITLLILSFWGVIPLLLVLVSTLPLAALAYRKIGGQTGDILGGVQQCAEVTALATLTVILT